MKYLDKEKAPVCLHVLGQPLVEAIFAEARTEIESLRRNNQAWQTELRIATQQRDSLLEACKRTLIDLACTRPIRSRITVSLAVQQQIREAIESCKEGGAK